MRLSILETLKDMTLEELNEVRHEILNIETKRGKDLLCYIGQGDLTNIRNTFRLGINWQDFNFWRGLYNLELTNINKETLDYLLKGNIPSIKVNSYLIDNFSHEMKKIIGAEMKNDRSIFETSHIFRELLKDRIQKKLTFGLTGFNETLFFNAKEYLGEEKFNNFLPRIIENFGQNDISNSSNEMHDYIIKNGLVKNLLYGISDKDSVEFFKNKKEYVESIKNLGAEYKEEIMMLAFKDAYMGKIKMLHEFGIPFPTINKQAYSDLFMKTSEDANEAQDYVISNIPNICFGNHVILKTMLHSTFNTDDEEAKINLIQKTLERYSDEDMKAMPAILAKREMTPRVRFATRYYEYRNLNLNMNENHMQERKLKI